MCQHACINILFTFSEVQCYYNGDYSFAHFPSLHSLERFLKLIKLVKFHSVLPHMFDLGPCELSGGQHTMIADR